MADTIQADLMLEMYRRMLLIRHFEDRIYYLFLQGAMPGTIHLYQGQEAVAVGVCSALRKDDVITSSPPPRTRSRQGCLGPVDDGRALG